MNLRYSIGSPDRASIALRVNTTPQASDSLECLLNSAGFVVHSSPAANALSELHEHSADVVLLEPMGALADSLELLRALRRGQITAPAAPVIYVSDEALSHAERLEFLKAGAWDVVIQPEDNDELLLRLQGVAATRQQTVRALSYGLVDDATQLYNVRGMETRSIEMAAQCARQGTLLACVTFGVQPSECIEDLLDSGQVAAVGAELRRSGRSSDAIGRTAHAEFTVLAPGVTGSDVKQLAHRLTARVESVLAEQGLHCETPWVGRLLQPSREAVRLGSELLRDTISALREIRESSEVPAST